MTNKKISALTSATTPLAGTEVLPIVQSGADTQVTVANLTAGRAVSAASLTTSNAGNANLIVSDGTYRSSLQQNSTTLYFNSADTTASAGSFTWRSSSAFTQLMALDASGSLGIAVAPINWSTNFKAVLQMGPYYTTLFQDDSAGSVLGAGVYGVAGGNYNMGYTGTGSTLRQLNGAFNWSKWTGTSGGLASGTTQMTLGTTGDLTLNTGNLVQGTAAKGINFTANTPAAGKTSQLLNWYEEGTFVATLTPNTSGTITLSSNNTLSYTRMGRVVVVNGLIDVASVSLPVGTYVLITTLPFTPASISPNAGRSGGAFGVLSTTAGNITPGLLINGGVATTYIAMNASTVQTGTSFYVQFTYITA